MPPQIPSSPAGIPSRTPSQSGQKKPIPLGKLSRARELYEIMEQALQRSQFEQQLQELPSQATMSHGHGGNYLDVPITPLRSRSRSTTSRSSRASATSSMERYEDLSQMTSVISFDDSVDHREHHRSPLAPYERAKAHLVRHLEACPRCRTKKVKCSLDHHDISSLRLNPEVKVEPIESRQPSIEPPSLRVEIPQTRSFNPGIEHFGHEASNSLEYMGSAPELLQGIGGSYAPQLDLTQSAVESGPFSAPVPNLPTSPNLHLSPNTFSPDLYGEETFQYHHVPNEFPLGQRRTSSVFGMTTHTYICLNCQETFLDLDECLLHFGTMHFVFNPIIPPLRLVCPGLKHFFRSYNDLRTCFCPEVGPRNVSIYGQMIQTSQANDQPTSAISNNTSSPNSRGSGYNRPFSHYQSPSWSPSPSGYGNNYFGGNGGSSGGVGYNFSNSMPPPHPSTDNNENQRPPHPSNIQITTHDYTSPKPNTPLNHPPKPITTYQATPPATSKTHYYIPKNHWMFRYQSYLQAASIVSFTLSAMFFGFGHAGEVEDLLAGKFDKSGAYIRGLVTSRILVGWTVGAFCCWAVWRFVRHFWGAGVEGSHPHPHPTTMATHQCAFLKITIPLSRSISASRPSTPYGVGGSFC